MALSGGALLWAVSWGCSRRIIKVHTIFIVVLPLLTPYSFSPAPVRRRRAGLRRAASHIAAVIRTLGG